MSGGGGSGGGRSALVCALSLSLSRSCLKGTESFVVLKYFVVRL